MKLFKYLVKTNLDNNYNCNFQSLSTAELIDFKVQRSLENFGTDENNLLELLTALKAIKLFLENGYYDAAKLNEDDFVDHSSVNWERLPVGFEKTSEHDFICNLSFEQDFYIGIDDISLIDKNIIVKTWKLDSFNNYVEINDLNLYEKKKTILKILNSGLNEKEIVDELNKILAEESRETHAQ